MKKAISISNVSFFYEEKAPILKRVNAEVEQGEFIGIVGPNGGGKTTLLKLLMGFLSPTEGSLLLNGEIPSRARKKIGYVPQALKTDRDFPITVEELIMLGALTQKLFYPKKAKEKALDLMKKLDLLPFKNAPFSSLSGGFMQRALFARALLSDPEFLFLDEPTANVDTASSKLLYDLLEEMKGEKTILLITHDLRAVIERVDRILCVDQQIVSLHPKKVCEHFALGLYHTPLADVPENHFKSGSDVPPCVFSK